MRANDPNLPYLRQIAEALGDLREQVVFVGGAVATAFQRLPSDPDFANVLPGLIAEPERSALIMQRLNAMSA